MLLVFALQHNNNCLQIHDVVERVLGQNFSLEHFVDSSLCSYQSVAVLKVFLGFLPFLCLVTF